MSALHSGIRPSVLLDACRLTAQEQSELVRATLLSAASADRVVVLKCDADGDTVLLLHASHFHRLLDDAAFWQRMSLVDVDSMLSRRLDSCEQLSDVRRFLHDALPHAQHGDIVALPDHAVYPPALVGMLLGYPTVYSRLQQNWQNELSVGLDSPLVLVQVRVESALLQHAPSAGQLRVAKQQKQQQVGHLIWSFSTPAPALPDSGALRAHFSALIDARRISIEEDQLHISQCQTEATTVLIL
jgi:hypothetical protein